MRNRFNINFGKISAKDTRSSRLANRFSRFKLGLLYKLMILFILSAALAWGINLQVHEGFIYAQSRGFNGDFFAAMFVPYWWDVFYWWDGSGVLYGPIFVFERKFVEYLPGIFTIRLFAFTNIVLCLFSFIAVLAATNILNYTNSIANSIKLGFSNLFSKYLIIGICLALWLCSSTLSYSFSVAANPEFVMLLSLTISWYFAKKGNLPVAYVLILIAALTKVIPVIFFAIYILHRSKNALKSAVSLLALVLITTSLIQKMSILETVIAVFIPSQNTSRGKFNLASAYNPHPESFEFLGVNSAISRICGPYCEILPQRIQMMSYIVIGLIILLSVIVFFRASKYSDSFPREVDLAFQYSLLFALLPIISPSSHLNYYLFLLPSFIGILSIILRDIVEERKKRGGVVLLILLSIYVVQSVSVIVVKIGKLQGSDLSTNLFLLDKSWSNLILILLILVYRNSWTKSVSKI